MLIKSAHHTKPGGLGAYCGPGLKFKIAMKNWRGFPESTNGTKERCMQSARRSKGLVLKQGVTNQAAEETWR